MDQYRRNKGDVFYGLFFFSSLLGSFFCCDWHQSGLPSYATVTIDINRGQVEPTPIALLLSGSSPEENALAVDLVKVMAADLERSGLFCRLIHGRFFSVQLISTIFPALKIGVSLMQVRAVANPRARHVSCVLSCLGCFSGQQLVGKAFADRKHWRRVAHVSADEIYKRLTGETGYFDTRIVYVA